MIRNILHTGQTRCYNSSGLEVPCSGTCQDAEFSTGIPWPEPRFEILDEQLVEDRLTGLVWTRRANFLDFPLTWPQALEEIRQMNAQGMSGITDWRLPNRRELRSLISHGARKPALPHGHPFEDVFLGWYWTSTTAAIFPAYAWYIHLEGGRMFYGKKDQRCLTWPVSGTSRRIPRTGQTACHDRSGNQIPCSGTGQDGELRLGQPWPEPRFTVHDRQVHDHLTGLIWYNPGDLELSASDWEQALKKAAGLDSTNPGWRLPSINELESLVDCSAHSPALPREHPFTGLEDAYWSSTTSFFEPDWAYALYLNKGAAGVGYKTGTRFHIWPVRNSSQ